jgi:fermentation-respiration switch protein FrsA (DUF1100 family)
MILKTLWIVLLTIGSLAVMVCVYLLAVAVLPGISAPKQPVSASGQAKPLPLETTGADVRFKVGKASIGAWLYLPQPLAAPVPCIVMGHGFGGTRDMGLAAYAVRFQTAGFAVLAFDYRHFGASEGEPRQLLWIPKQLEDWAAAIAFARSRPEIDPARIALWGTSLSGGHVIVAAAEDNKIACVIAQCPGLDGREAAKIAFTRHGIGHGLKMMVHGQRDLVRSWLGLSPHKIPIFGMPGTIACLTTPDAHEAVKRLAPEGFSNEVCARITIRGDKYRPVESAGKVRCPVLLQICDKDDLVPPSTARESIARLGKYAQVIRYPIGHFDIYFDQYFAKAVQDQLAFFKQHLV